MVIGRWILLAALLLAPVATHAQEGACEVDRAGMLAMDQETFDQSVAGWRSLAERPGCETAAADLIAAYRTAHAAELVNGSLARIQFLNWHEAQLLAAAGETQRALSMFAKAHPLLSAPGFGDPYYADATIAFLKRDRDALLRARRTLSALPKPASFEKLAAQFEAQTGSKMSWPDNLDVVDGLIACFDKPYKEAYSLACRELGTHRKAD